MTRWLQWDVWLHWQLMHWHAEKQRLNVHKYPPRGGWWGWWGVRRLRLLLHLLLHSLQVQDVLYFALFVCRGKQLEERHREKNRREQDLSRVFTALKWLCIYSFNPRKWTFKLACISQKVIASKCMLPCVQERGREGGGRERRRETYVLLSSSLDPLLTDHYGEAFIMPLDGFH